MNNLQKNDTSNHQPYAVELKEVSKHYPGTPPVKALSDVNMSVAQG